MKKKIFAVLIATILLCACLPLGAVSVSAETFELYEGMYYYEDGDDVGIWGLEGSLKSKTTITIPKTIKGKPVTSLHDYAFDGCNNLISVTLSENMLAIGESTFTGLEKLETVIVHPDNPKYSSIDGVLYNKKITVLYAYPAAKKDVDYIIPNSVTTIQAKAFYACNNLSSVTLPSGVATIEESTFSECDKLTSITIPEGVTSIKNSAFSFCDRLESINVMETNTCYSSIDGVLLNKEKTTLLLYPYGKKEDIYTIPAGITIIGYRAFENCIGLSSVVVPDGVTSVDTYAFCGSSLSSITLPDTISLHSGVFAFCKKLKSVILPYGMYSIPDQTFDGCNALTSVTFWNTVTFIKESAFNNCNRLTDIYYYGTEQDKSAISIGQNNDALVNVEWHYKTPPTTTTTESVAALDTSDTTTTTEADTSTADNTTPASATAVKMDAPAERDEDSGNSGLILALGVGIGVLLAAVVVLLILLLKKKKSA